MDNMKKKCYEYALLCAVSDLFGSVVNRSNVEPLKLYFAELPDEKKETGTMSQSPGTKKKTKEDFLKEVSALVEDKVCGHVEFPMMHICRAEMSVIPEEDGTYTHLLTGIGLLNEDLQKSSGPVLSGAVNIDDIEKAWKAAKELHEATDAWEKVDNIHGILTDRTKKS